MKKTSINHRDMRGQHSNNAASVAERQVVIDCETTGLSVEQGHRIIEIACVEMRAGHSTGSELHHYLNPGRPLSLPVSKVTGLNDTFLSDKPSFRDIANELTTWLRDTTTVAWLVSFDAAFLNAELVREGHGPGWIDCHCRLIDVRELVRSLYPDEHCSLEATCRRYGISTDTNDLPETLRCARQVAKLLSRLNSK